jgi:hypothetical protein
LADFCLIVLRKAAVPLKLPNLTVPVYPMPANGQNRPSADLDKWRLPGIQNGTLAFGQGIAIIVRSAHLVMDRRTIAIQQPMPRFDAREQCLAEAQCIERTLVAIRCESVSRHVRRARCEQLVSSSLHGGNFGDALVLESNQSGRNFSGLSQV